MTSNSGRSLALQLCLIGAGLIDSGVATFLIATTMSREEIASFDSRFSQADGEKIERGGYLARAGNCASCHTATEGEYMAGGLPFETPFGTIHSTNITPDADTGIGSGTGEQFLVSMRRGKRPNGEHLYPVFPYTSLTNFPDDDISGICAYFLSIPPVKAAAFQNDITFPFNQRILTSIRHALFLDDGSEHVLVLPPWE